MSGLSFCSLSSGSSGNSYWIGYGNKGILVDAGISARSIRGFLKTLDFPLASIMGILVTHNHTDHIKGLEQLTRKNNIPAFTTAKVWESILKPGCMIPVDCIRRISIRKKFEVAGLTIEAFPVSHDAPETLGYQVSAGDKKITVATDLGFISDIAAGYLKEANLIVMESNYDRDMLDNGRYPYFLKERISSDHGHLGNHQASEFLSGIVGDEPRHICLAHLSRNNNTPELVLKTINGVLAEKGIVLNGSQKISVLERNRPSDIIRLS